MDRDRALLELELAARNLRQAHDGPGVMDFANYKDAKARLWHALDDIDQLDDDGGGMLPNAADEFAIPSDPNLFGEPQDEAPLLELEG